MPIHAFRFRLLGLLIAAGLAVPTMPVAGDDCQLAELPAAQSCAESAADTCCPAETDQPREGEDEDHDCCPSGCECICCGCAVVPVLHRSVGAQVTRVPPSTTLGDWSLVIRPQKAVGELLHPPQA